MPALQVRDLPQGVYRLLQQSAERDRRSLAQQTTFRLERALNGENREAVSNVERRKRVLEEIDRATEEMDFGKLQNPAELIREDRDGRGEYLFDLIEASR